MPGSARALPGNGWEAAGEVRPLVFPSSAPHQPPPRSPAFPSSPRAVYCCAVSIARASAWGSAATSRQAELRAGNAPDRFPSPRLRRRRSVGPGRARQTPPGPAFPGAPSLPATDSSRRAQPGPAPLRHRRHGARKHHGRPHPQLHRR